MGVFIVIVDPRCEYPDECFGDDPCRAVANNNKTPSMAVAVAYEELFFTIGVK